MEASSMITDDTVARLDQQLTRQGLGPLEAISDQTVAALVSWIRVIATGLSQAARDRPLTALLIALEVGYAIGRSGRRVARRQATCTPVSSRRGSGGPGGAAQLDRL
jgi:hypothetical protein